MVGSVTGPGRSVFCGIRVRIGFDPEGGVEIVDGPFASIRILHRIDYDYGVPEYG